MKGYKEEGKLMVGEHEVYNLMNQKVGLSLSCSARAHLVAQEVKMVIKHEDGKEEAKSYELGHKGQYTPPAYVYD